MDSCICFFVDKNTYIANQTTWTSEYISLLFVSIIISSKASIEMTENLKFQKSRVKSTKTTKHFHSMRVGAVHGGPRDVSGKDPVNVSNILLGAGFHKRRSQSLNCQTVSVCIFKEIQFYEMLLFKRERLKLHDNRAKLLWTFCLPYVRPNKNIS